LKCTTDISSINNFVSGCEMKVVMDRWMNYIVLLK
jgi:hypothetical protein